MPSLIAAPPSGGVVLGTPYLLALPRPRGQGLRAPEGCPLHLQELVDALYLDALALLDGLDPDAVGVLLVHPSYDLHEPHVDTQGHIVAYIKPLAWLVEHSTLSPGVPPRPGRFFAVLVAGDLTARWCGPRARRVADARSLS